MINNNRYIKFLIFLLSLTFLFSSCGGNDTSENSDLSLGSDAEDAFLENNSNQNNSEESAENEGSSPAVDSEDGLESEDDFSEEVSKEPISASDSIDDFMKNTFEKVNFNYNVTATLNADNTTVSLECGLFAENTFVSSRVILKSGEQTILNRTNFYKDGQAFITDEMLGDSRFQLTRKDFLSIVSEFDPYYFLSECATDYLVSDNPENNDEVLLQYSLTEDILKHPALSLLFSTLNAASPSFEDGAFSVGYNFSDKQITFGSSSIAGKYLKEQTEIPFNIKIDVSFDEKPKEETSLPPSDKYKNFFTYKSFLFSKATYKLSEFDAYEVLVTTRAYKSKATAETKSFYDFTLNFASSFKDSPASSFILKLETSPNQIYEKYLYNNEEYTRAYTEGTKVPAYQIAASDGTFSKKETVNLWNVMPFDLSQTSSYTISETDVYYVIDYTYNPNSTKEIFKKLHGFWSANLPNYSFFSKNELSSVDSSTVKKAEGTLVIRKSDYIMVESSFDISILTSEKKTFRIINQIEVIALDEDVTVINPDK